VKKPIIEIRRGAAVVQNPFPDEEKYGKEEKQLKWKKEKTSKK